MKTLKVFVYGAGRAGRSIARAIEAADEKHKVFLCGAWNRSFPRAFESSRLLDVEVSSGDAIPEQMIKADVILLSVVDDAVRETAGLLARHLGRKQVLLHVSGSRAAEVMRGEQMSAHLGGLHPLQALASREGDPEKLRGAAFAIEGDAEALEAARRIAEAVGGNPIPIRPEARALYHAAAVTSANFVTVLMDLACDMLGKAGVDPLTSVEILLPLLEGTVDQIRERQERAKAQDQDPQGRERAGRAVLSEALTGPIRRGDSSTVRKHLKALKRLDAKDPSEAARAETYRLLSLKALEIAQRGDLSEEGAEKLAKALL